MKYIVEGFDTNDREWKTLSYKTEDGRVHDTFPLRFMAEHVVAEYKRIWPGEYRVKEVFNEQK